MSRASRSFCFSSGDGSLVSSDVSVASSVDEDSDDGSSDDGRAVDSARASGSSFAVSVSDFAVASVVDLAVVYGSQAASDVGSDGGSGRDSVVDSSAVDLAVAALAVVVSSDADLDRGCKVGASVGNSDGSSAYLAQVPCWVNEGGSLTAQAHLAQQGPGPDLAQDRYWGCVAESLTASAHRHRRDCSALRHAS